MLSLTLPQVSAHSRLGYSSGFCIVLLISALGYMSITSPQVYTFLESELIWGSTV
jgi:hypothetical protein